MHCPLVLEDLGKLGRWSGMKATAELPSQAKKAESDIVFSCICSNKFMSILFLDSANPSHLDEKEEKLETRTVSASAKGSG